LNPLVPPAGDHAKDHREEASISRAYFVAGGLLSVAAGLLCALITFGIVLFLAGGQTEGENCSFSKIGSYEVETAWEEIVYVDEGWSGLLPAQHCSAYLVDATGGKPSRHMVAESTYPGTREYAWVAGAFLLPLALWGLFLAIAWLASRHKRVDA
jgi:hypothetical protein